MNGNYTNEKNAQILIALLKKRGINQIVASPGTTNINFVYSLQNDPFFKIYSAVDERSAAYMACGLAEETNSPVVLSCTGATASRNYFPGLTEAYYRKLPILAVTSSRASSFIGHNFAQVTDRNSITADVVQKSYLMQLIKDTQDWNDCEIKANKAMNDLLHRGGGPVHINLETKNEDIFDVKDLPNVRAIDIISKTESFPEIKSGRIGIFVGSHSKMNKELTNLIDDFCEKNNAVVFCDHTSGYRGNYEVQHSIGSSQTMSSFTMKPDLTIQIGEISGDYSSVEIIGKEVWRVNEDGKLKDQFGKLSKVFEVSLETFFKHYNSNSYSNINTNTYYSYCINYLNSVRNKIPEIPFSNIWIAKQLHDKLPENSTIHLGILNSLRSWNFFELPKSIYSNSNVGGFGIDGSMSSLIGASLSNENKLFFGVFGDLSFFYDINSLGNRHIGNNLRILLINNGVGQEFRNYNNLGGKLGDSSNDFIAARGHFGNQSKSLVKNYSENLGFHYITAQDKDQFNLVYKTFISPDINKSIVFEVFTQEVNETIALKTINTIDVSLIGRTKKKIKDIIGPKNIDSIKTIYNKLK